MTRWATDKQFGSWLGLAPNNRVSSGKVLSPKATRLGESRRTSRSANRAATALRVAAQSVHHSHSALGAYLRRKAAQLGMPKAITATAYKLARIIYQLLSKGRAFVDPGEDYYEHQYRARVLKQLTRRAQELGFQLVPQEEASLQPAQA